MTAPVVTDPNNPTNQPKPTTSGQPATAPDGGMKPPPAAEPVTTIVDQRLVLAKIAQLEDDNKKLAAKLDDSTKPPPISSTDANKRFWENPVEVVSEMLKETVKPLIEFRDDFKKETAYERLKGQFKNDARFKDFLSTPGVEGYVDQIMAKNPSTEEAMIGALVGARGAMEFGLIPKPAPAAAQTTNQPTNQKVDNSMLPPHLRPSAPPADELAGKKPAARELTENERRLARENRMTPEEFLEFQEVHPLDVVSFKTTKEKEKETKK